MNIRTIALVTILIAVLTVAVALIFADQSQYSNPITVDSGKVTIATTNGTQSYNDVEYITGNVVSVKPSAIMPVTPVSLPNTSAPHGTNTCTMVDNHGNNYDVSTDQTCDTLK